MLTPIFDVVDVVTVGLATLVVLSVLEATDKVGVSDIDVGERKHKGGLQKCRILF